MRYIRLTHFIYIVILLFLDVVLGSILQQFPILQGASASLHFIGLIVLSKTDSVKDSILKAFLVSLWLDINHIGTFPIFAVSYILTLIFVQSWNRHVGNTLFELSVQVVVALFVREMLVWAMLPFVKNIYYSPLDFIAEYGVWTLLINVMFVPFVFHLNQKLHHYVLQRNQNMRISR